MIFGRNRRNCVRVTLISKRVLRADRICFGDTVGIVAPASPPPDPAAVDRAAATLEAFGFRPKPGKQVRARHGFLAGSDRDRATDLMAMFADKKVKAILCLRGGYGSARLLDRLDYEVIRRQPKIFSGYSDITSLHGALARKTGLITFHGPMLNSELSSEKLPEFTRNSFFRTLMEAVPAGSLTEGCPEKNLAILRRGVAEGRLIGGNLSVLCASLGTPYAPDFKGRILFVEDIAEKPYRLDRLFTQLANAGVLAQVAGVAVGMKTDCTDPVAATAKEFRQTAADVVKERLGSLKVPVVMGLPFGHGPLNATLPVGALARLDGKRGDLIVMEAAVR